MESQVGIVGPGQPGQPRMNVYSLLSDGQSSRVYSLEVIQQPQCTAEFAQANLSRLPLTPPMIVRLVVRDASGHSINPEEELPFLVAYLSLYTGDGATSLDEGSSPGGSAPRRRLLYGNTVASSQRLRDMQGRLGNFFMFPDVSVRYRGQFQLQVNLSRVPINEPGTSPTATSEPTSVLAEVRTRPFDVVRLEEYVAPAPTRMTQMFVRQGAQLYTSAPPNPLIYNPSQRGPR